MDRIRTLLNDKKPLTWVFLGDSITHGAAHTFGWRDYTELFAERVRAELSRHMDMVIDSAINGDKTDGLVRTFDWRVARFQPDVVFIMIGMNDCCCETGVPLDAFGENLDTLVGKTTALGALPILQTTCPVLPGQGMSRAPYVAAYMDVIRAKSAEHKVPLIDHAEEWNTLGDTLNFWMNNAFHPNAYGHRAFARRIFRELGIWDETGSRTCRLMIP